MARCTAQRQQGVSEASIESPQTRKNSATQVGKGRMPTFGERLKAPRRLGILRCQLQGGIVVAVVGEGLKKHFGANDT
jgi:hypothetical protein